MNEAKVGIKDEIITGEGAIDDVSGVVDGRDGHEAVEDAILEGNLLDGARDVERSGEGYNGGRDGRKVYRTVWRDDATSKHDVPLELRGIDVRDDPNDFIGLFMTSYVRD